MTVKQEHLTTTYFNREDKDFFYMAYKTLFTASHWVDPVTEEEVKLTHNIKAVYIHKMDQYKSFSGKGMLYHESHQTVADKLGVSLKVVEETAIPLLKRMGLIYIESLSTRKHITTMYPVKLIRGYLINKKLEKHHKRVKRKKSTKDSISYEQLKNVEHNKKQIEKIKKNTKEKLFVLTEDDMKRLRGKVDE